jgi:ADP-ribose pyrophosphatase YjhB (NUDIX family)
MEAFEEVIRRQAVRLMAVAQTGLAYGRDKFDHERYRQVMAAGKSLLELVTSGPLPASLNRHTAPDQGYATPKVDVRGAVFDQDERLLLVQERSDRRWTLPGGWCDVGESPAEAVCREVAEESGLKVRADRLAAVLDRERRGHWPPMPVHVYKLFFLCTPVAGAPGAVQELETLDVGWFGLDELPVLSVSRVTEEELRLLLAAHRDPARPTVFD